MRGTCDARSFDRAGRELPVGALATRPQWRSPGGRPRSPRRLAGEAAVLYSVLRECPWAPSSTSVGAGAFVTSSGDLPVPLEFCSSAHGHRYLRDCRQRPLRIA